MSMLELYTLFVLLPGLNAFGEWLLMFAIGAGILIAWGGIVLYSNIKDTENEEMFLKALKRSALTTLAVIVLASVLTFAPTEKQVLLLAGGYAATNNKEISSLPENIAKAANAYLGELTKSLEKEKK